MSRVEPLVEPSRVPTRHTVRSAIITFLAVGALCLPSSVGGIISRPLTIVALLMECAALGALAATGTASPLLVLNSLAIVATMSLWTLTTRLDAVSPGVAFIYAAIALLFVVDLRSVAAGRRVRQTFLLINIMTIGTGMAITLDVRAVDDLLIRFYSAYYPELVSNMVGLFDKPVFTFGTHSTAGFMEYLFFHMCLGTFQITRRRIFIGFALGHLALMLALRSTTGTLFGAIAVLQLSWHILRRHQWAAIPSAAGAVGAATLLAVVFEASTAGVAAGARSAILGDRMRGLIARYSSEGLLAGNIAYIMQHPLSPTGLGYSSQLYFGDSGIVVNFLRGSLPLVTFVYGGLLAFLRGNLRSRSTAVWLFLIIVAFEIGFTPLQYFRFVGFVPFMVVYLNSLIPDVNRTAST